MRPPKAATTLPAALAASTGFILSKAAQRAAALTEAALQPFGLKPRHYGVLMLLGERGPDRQQQIGATLQLDRTTMAAIADDLERLRLAVRQPDPRNRRANALRLTATGVQLLAQLGAVVSAADQALLAPLGESERQQLHQLLLPLITLDRSVRNGQQTS
jgi:DNA-binding MarR family transcriptional regulator